MKKLKMLVIPGPVEMPNPKEGRSLGLEPDDPGFHFYPVKYPKGADAEIERSILGKGENVKTYFQEDLDKEDE